MGQRKGIYYILSNSFLYELVQFIFSHKKTKDTWNELVKIYKNKVILDIGCGPGKTSLDFKNSKKYIGIDTSQEYIDNANKKYSNFGDFYCLSADRINEGPLKEISNIDLVILKGVFYHLNDKEIIQLLKKLKNKIKPNGEVLSLDPTFLKGRYLANFTVS